MDQGAKGTPQTLHGDDAHCLGDRDAHSTMLGPTGRNIDNILSIREPQSPGGYAPQTLPARIRSIEVTVRPAGQPVVWELRFEPTIDSCAYARLTYMCNQI